MTKVLKILSRHQLDTTAWDACIAASPQRILYGYSWYLDAVLPAPFWKWAGIVLADELGQYQAVMPIPLRRKTLVGLTYAWVVYQPFFCQFLDIFSLDASLSSAPFFELMTGQFRYGSVYCTRQQPTEPLTFDAIQIRSTHTLNLAVGYKTIFQNYTPDRKLNLRRARRRFDKVADWSIVDSTDLEPLLALFRDNHADAINGGVAGWAYDILRTLVNELSKRGLCTLRYAIRDGHIEAGALFACEGDRIIYLFNAASEAGRRGNARTLLIDQLIQENAGRPLVFDFESPEKPSIRDFYQSFGATEESFQTMRWNRLTSVERAFLTLKSWF